MDIYRKICVEIFSDLNNIRTNKTELLINYETELKRAHISHRLFLLTAVHVRGFLLLLLSEYNAG